MPAGKPDLSGPGRRALATAVDVLLAGVLTLLVARTAGIWFAERATAMLRAGSLGGPIVYVANIFGSIVYGAPFALFLVSLSELLFDGSPGKWLLTLRIADSGGHAPAVSKRALRWALKWVGSWGLVLAFLLGTWQLAFAALACGACILLGSFGAFSGSRSAMHDRISGTVVASRT